MKRGGKSSPGPHPMGMLSLERGEGKKPSPSHYFDLLVLCPDLHRVKEGGGVDMYVNNNLENM